MSELDNPDSSSDSRTYTVSYTLDRDGFFRRECPDCGLHFKVVPDEAEKLSLLSPEIKEISSDPGSSSEITNAETNGQMTCPYCGHTDRYSNMLTDEVINYGRRLLSLEVHKRIFPKLNRSFRELATVGRRSGLIEVRHDPLTLPPRPLYGPDLPDMKKVVLLCCGKKIKILSGWRFRTFCPFCAQEAVLQ